MVCRLGTSSPDESLEEEPLSPARAGHVQRPCHAFPELLRTLVPAADVPQGCQPPCVSCSLRAPPHRQWGGAACMAPARCSHERSMGYATGGQGWLRQHGRAPTWPSGKGRVFFMLPPLQSHCRKQAARVDDDACDRSNPLLLLITWQGQLLVRYGKAQDRCYHRALRLGCCNLLFSGRQPSARSGAQYLPLCSPPWRHRASQRWMLKKGAVRGQIFLVPPGGLHGC